MIAYSGRNVLLGEPVSGFEFTSVDVRSVLVNCKVAISPAQEQIGSDRKNNRVSIYLGLDTRSFRRRRQTEIEGLAENYRIELAHNIADHGVNDLSL